MTKIHPEAEVELDAVKGSEIITTMGEGNYVSAVYKDRALEALSQALFERDALRAQVAEMREALEPLRNMEMWTESAEDNEICILTYGVVKRLRALILKDNPND